MVTFTSKIKTKIDVFCNKVFDGFFSFFRKNLFLIVAIILVIVSLGAKFCFIEYASGDFNSFLKPWFNYIKSNGGFKALSNYPTFDSNPSCDYPIAYMTIIAALTYLPFEPIVSIKIVCFIFDLALALGGLFLVKEITKNKFWSYLSFYILLFLPTLFLNSALWSQCDQLYACFAVWCLYFILKKKNNLAMIMIGCAFSCKMHIIFIFPALIYFWLSKKITLRNMLFIPLVIMITWIPGLINGVSPSVMAKIYVSQAGNYSNANYGAANMYAFMQFSYAYRHINMGAGILIAFAIIGIFLTCLYYHKVKVTKKNMLYIATMSALLTPFVLPHMHDRYFFLADILVLLYVIVHKRKWYLAVMMQASSYMCYTQFLLRDYVFNDWLKDDSVQVAACINLAIIIIMCYEFKNLEKEDDEFSLPLIENN